MSITSRLRRARIPAALLCASAILAACQDTAVQPADNAARPAESSDPLVQRVVAMGFDEASIEDRGDILVVEGDIVFDKSRLAQLTGPLAPPVRRPGGPSFQYVVDSPVLQSVMAQGIRVSLVNIASSSAWTNAMRQAMLEWNVVGSNKIKFVEVTSSADITVVFGSGMSNSDIASARYPINGYPGWQININTYHNSKSASVKLRAMAHELGHTIGFRHSNWPTNDNHPGGANLIPGTPTSDNNSVMYSFIGSWNGFNSNDRTASSYVYPVHGTTITSQGYDGAGNFTMSWTPVAHATQYKIWFETWYEEWVYDPTYYPNGGYYAWTPNNYVITTTSATTFSDPGQGTGPTPYACGYHVTPVYPNGKEGYSVRSMDVTC